MGRIAEVVAIESITKNDVPLLAVTVSPGGGADITVFHIAPPGDDSQPLIGDWAVIQTMERSGTESIVGYVDPNNTPKVLAGEKRIYARDPETGLTVVEVWLRGDGTALTENAAGFSSLSPEGIITGANSNGSFQLQDSGDFVVNGVTIKADGQVIIPSSLLLNSKEIDGHTHSQANDGGGDSQADTGGNN